MDFEIIKSQRGKPVLIKKGHMYNVVVKVRKGQFGVVNFATRYRTDVIIITINVSRALQTVVMIKWII